MTRLSRSSIQAIAGVVVVAVVVGVVYFVFFRGGGTRSVTAEFDSAVGVYTGTPVKILGVEVGEVTSVTPEANYVKVAMEYDSKYKVPPNASAVVYANSLVSDRYIQLTPVWTKGATLADKALIPRDKTQTPAELDDIDNALNTLAVTLGPKGANKTGALSTLLKVGSANLKGNGQALNDSIGALSDAAKTLADNRGNLFQTVDNLNAFTKALKGSDAQVRNFEGLLTQVASDLASERGDLGSSLHNLGIALDDVAGFVKDNASGIHTDLGGLTTITNLLVKEQASLNETLSLAGPALANVVHSYQPAQGIIASRGNLNSLSDPGQICGLINGLVSGLVDKGLLGSLPSLQKILGQLTTPIVNACKTATSQATSAVPGAEPANTGSTGGLNLSPTGLPIVPGASS